MNTNQDNKCYTLVVITTRDNPLTQNKAIFLCSTLNECKNILIDYLTKIFNELNIDFPIDILEFEYKWFTQNYVDINCFDYIIINPNDTNLNVWNSPWELGDIYSDVTDRIYQDMTTLEMGHESSDDSM